MAAYENRLRVALAIISGRKSELDQDDYEALGYRPSAFHTGTPSLDEVKWRAEESCLNALLFMKDEMVLDESPLREVVIQDGTDGGIELYQGRNYVFLDEDDIAAVIATKFELRSFGFDDLIDMLREWEEAKGCKREGASTTMRKQLTPKAQGAIYTYLAINGFSFNNQVFKMVQLLLEAERMPRASLYAWLQERGYRYRSADRGRGWYAKYTIVKIDPYAPLDGDLPPTPKEGRSNDAEAASA